MADFSLNVKINGVEQAVTTVAQIEQALRATKEELKNVEIGSQAFENLSKQAVNLQRELVNSFKETTNFNKNIAELGQSVGSLASTVTAGFSIATSAISLFGTESEELTQAQAKAQQALALALAATTIATNAKTLSEDIGNVAAALGLNLTRQKVVATEASTVATVGQTIATETAAVAQEGLNVAMAANPIGLVLVALTALIGALVLFSDEEETAKTNIEATNRALLDQASLQQKQTDDFEKLFRARRKLYEEEAKTEDERAKRKAETEKLITDITAESLKSQEKNLIDANNNAIKEAGKYSEAFIGTKRELVREVAQFDEFGVFIGNEAEYRDVSYKIGEEVITNIKNQFTNRKKLIEEQVKSEKITREEGNILIAQAETEKYIQILTKQQQFFKSSNDADDKNIAENLKTTLDAFKATRDAYEKFYQGLLADKIAQQEKEREEEEKRNKEREAEAKRQAEIAKQGRERINNDVKQALEELRKIEQQNIIELQKLRLENDEKIKLDNKSLVEGKVGLLELELQETNKNIKKIYEEQVKAVNDSKFLSKSQKDAKKKDLETELKDATASAQAIFDYRRRLAAQEDTFAKIDLDRRLKRLQIENQILLNEVAVGDQNVLDTKAEFQNKQIEVEIQARQFIRGLNDEEYNRLLSTLDATEKAYLDSLGVRRADQATSYQEAVQDEVAFQQKLADLRKKQRENEFTASVNAAQAERVRAIDDATSRLEQEYNIRLVKDQEYVDEKTGLTLTSYKIEGDISEEQSKLIQERVRLVQVNETQKSEAEVLQIKAEYRQKEFTEATQDAKKLAEARNAILIKTTNDFTAVLQNLANTTDNAYAGIAASLSQAFADFTALSTQTFESTTEKVLAYTNAVAGALTGIISNLGQVFADFYANQVNNLEVSANEQKDIRTQQYNDELNELVANRQAGLITEQQYKDAQFNLNANYQNSVKAIEEQRLKEELKIKKKAFDADKALKITQAIIAGAQGAVQAFTSAMTIPPPAGPILGGILAGAVGVLTAAQVAVIAKQQFNPGQTVTQSSATLPVGTGGADLGGAGQLNQASSGGFTGFNQGLVGQTGTGITTTPIGDTQMGQRVYVLESDITNTQRRVSTLESNATFG